MSPPSRADRNERRQRSRRAEAIVGTLVVLVAGVYAWSRSAVPAEPSASPAASASPSPSPAATAELAVLSVTGGSGPMVLVFGRAGAPLAISFPSELTQVVPGMGETSLATLGGLDGSTLEVAVSNTLGVWVDHYGVVSAHSIATAVKGAGGFTIDLGRAFTANGTIVGPGTVKLTGPQVAAFLSGPKAVVAARWGAFTSALLTQRLPLPPSAFVDTDDAAGVSRLLQAARGARMTNLPVSDVGGFLVAPDLRAIDVMARTLLGTRGAPTPVIVQNGNGVPGVGARVAERLIPAGFRVVLSTNAQTFSVARTSIIALGGDVAGAASRARDALGVGKVIVSSVPSGVGDVKIIAGKDFK